MSGRHQLGNAGRTNGARGALLPHRHPGGRRVPTVSSRSVLRLHGGDWHGLHGWVLLGHHRRVGGHLLWALHGRVLLPHGHEHPRCMHRGVILSGRGGHTHPVRGRLLLPRWRRRTFALSAGDVRLHHRVANRGMHGRVSGGFVVRVGHLHRHDVFGWHVLCPRLGLCRGLPHRLVLHGGCGHLHPLSCRLLWPNHGVAHVHVHRVVPGG